MRSCCPRCVVRIALSMLCCTYRVVHVLLYISRCPWCILLWALQVKLYFSSLGLQSKGLARLARLCSRNRFQFVCRLGNIKKISTTRGTLSLVLSFSPSRAHALGSKSEQRPNTVVGGCPWLLFFFRVRPQSTVFTITDVRGGHEESRQKMNK